MRADAGRRPGPRLLLLLAGFALWAAAIAWRLAALQVTEHEDYKARAEEQQRLEVELEPPRGPIYDARGRELAVSVEVDSAWADPRQLAAAADPAAVARDVAELTGVDAEALAARLADPESRFVWVARQLDRPQAEAVADLGIPGVGFVKEYKRYYPMGELAAQVIGYAGIDQRGLAGLEHRFESRIAGRQGRKTLLRDARHGTAATPLLAAAGAPPRPGASLRLTLDATVQRIAERELAHGVEAAGAKRGSVVILDPATGAVLAMASYPPLDANRFTAGDAARRRNLPVMDAYEPGSTFKMVTAAAALSANLLDPSDELECEMGAIELEGVRIRDHRPFGRLTLREVIARSSNVGAVKTGLAVGDEGLYEAVEAFGFGHPTGVDLPAENPGELSPLATWRRWPLTKAYVSFGQGISITPLQLVRAFAAVANGGELLRPYVVAAVEAPGGAVERTERRVDGRPLSAATAREVGRMLEAVVAEGTGKAAAVPGYAVAGKTGTAQKAVPGAGYSATRFVASFVGFTPARRPALAMAVVIDEPWPRYHGGEVAAPVFARIAAPVLLYLGVPPDGAPLDPELPPIELALAGEGAPGEGAPDSPGGPPA